MQKIITDSDEHLNQIKWSNVMEDNRERNRSGNSCNVIVP